MHTATGGHGIVTWPRTSTASSSVSARSVPSPSVPSGSIDSAGIAVLTSVPRSSVGGAITALYVPTGGSPQHTPTSHTSPAAWLQSAG